MFICRPYWLRTQPPRKASLRTVAPEKRSALNQPSNRCVAAALRRAFEQGNRSDARSLSKDRQSPRYRNLQSAERGEPHTGRGKGRQSGTDLGCGSLAHITVSGESRKLTLPWR